MPLLRRRCRIYCTGKGGVSMRSAWLRKVGRGRRENVLADLEGVKFVLADFVLLISELEEKFFARGEEGGVCEGVGDVEPLVVRERRGCDEEVQADESEGVGGEVGVAEGEDIEVERVDVGPVRGERGWGGGGRVEDRGEEREEDLVAGCEVNGGVGGGEGGAIGEVDGGRGEVRDAGLDGSFEDGRERRGAGFARAEGVVYLGKGGQDDSEPLGNYALTHFGGVADCLPRDVPPGRPEPDDDDCSPRELFRPAVVKAVLHNPLSFGPTLLPLLQSLPDGLTRVAVMPVRNDEVVDRLRGATSVDARQNFQVPRAALGVPGCVRDLAGKAYVRREFPRLDDGGMVRFDVVVQREQRGRRREGKVGVGHWGRF